MEACSVGQGEHLSLFCLRVLSLLLRWRQMTLRGSRIRFGGIRRKVAIKMAG